MKKIIYLLLAFNLFIVSAYSQERDSLVQLYAGIGDTIDLFNREFFDLYSNVEGFQDASLYIRGKDKLVSRLELQVSRGIVDTIIINSLSSLEIVRLNISKLDEENNKKSGIERDVIVGFKDERQIEGQLNMFSKSNLYLFSENNNENNISQSQYLMIPTLNVNEVNILGQNKTWSQAGWGALIGLAIGGISYFSTENNSKNLRGIELISTPILGGLIGLIIGAAASTNDEVYKINSEYDLLKLKDYAKYYFRYDESVDEKYLELE